MGAQQTPIGGDRGAIKNFHSNEKKIMKAIITYVKMRFKLKVTLDKFSDVEVGMPRRHGGEMFVPFSAIFLVDSNLPRDIQTMINLYLRVEGEYFDGDDFVNVDVVLEGDGLQKKPLGTQHDVKI